jgi:hypothetical protein
LLWGQKTSDFPFRATAQQPVFSRSLQGNIP